MADDHIIGSGMTEQELRLSSFWIRNRILLRQILYGALIAFNVVLWLFVLWSLLDWLAISYPYESRIPLKIASNQITAESLVAATPKPLQPSQTYVFDSTSGRRDILVELSNPNPQWYAAFEYKFDIAGQQTPARQGFILPQSQRYITELGFASSTERTARLIVDNIRWMRVDPAWVNRDYKSFAESRLAFDFQDVKYTRDLVIGTQTIGRTDFTMVNDTPYGYWNVELTVILYRGTSPVGVTTITRRDVKPGEAAPISINWYENLPGITRTEIRASVNILDPEAYLSSERFQN